MVTSLQPSRSAWPPAVSARFDARFTMVTSLQPPYAYAFRPYLNRIMAGSRTAPDVGVCGTADGRARWVPHLTVPSLRRRLARARAVCVLRHRAGQQSLRRTVAIVTSDSAPGAGPDGGIPATPAIPASAGAVIFDRAARQASERASIAADRLARRLRELSERLEGMT